MVCPHLLPAAFLSLCPHSQSLLYEVLCHSCCLLAFSRRQPISLRPVNLNELIKGVEKLLLRFIGEDIEMKTTLSEKDMTVMADPGQLEQAFMNLATNARDAMPEGGMLTIETSHVDIDEGYANSHLFAKPGTYALPWLL